MSAILQPVQGGVTAIADSGELTPREAPEAPMIQDRFARLLDRAEAARAKGDYRGGTLLLEQAVADAAVSGDACSEATALRLLANQLLRTGAIEAAARAAERSVRLFDAIGAEDEVCDTLNVLALAYIELGLNDEALDSITRGLAIARALNDRRLLYWAFNRTGVVHGELGDPETGMGFLRQALDLASALGREEEFCIRNNLATGAYDLVETLRTAGRRDAAEAALNEGLGFAAEGLRIAREAAHPYRETIVLNNQAMLLLLADDCDAAMAATEAASEIAARHGYDAQMMTTRHIKALVTLRRGGTAAAAALLADVLEEAQAGSIRPLAARICQQLAEIQESLGDPMAALQYFKRYHVTQRAIQTAVAETRARLLTDTIALENSKIETARARLEADMVRARSVLLEVEKLELSSKAAVLEQHANQDALTGLWNRRYLDGPVTAQCDRLMAEGRPACVMVCDLDWFKSVNDTFGHATGDTVLRWVARLLLQGSRPADVVARLGGDEFVLFLVDTNLAGARPVGERIRAAVAAHDWAQLQAGLQVAVSIGIAPCTPNGGLAAAMQAADESMYQEKRARGRA